jgi:hypothetical protein
MYDDKASEYFAKSFVKSLKFPHIISCHPSLRHLKDRKCRPRNNVRPIKCLIISRLIRTFDTAFFLMTVIKEKKLLYKQSYSTSLYGLLKFHELQFYLVHFLEMKTLNNMTLYDNSTNHCEKLKTVYDMRARVSWKH